jgi:HEAT repeat protein
MPPIILFFRFGMMTNEPTWFYYLMMGGFNIAYLLNNLEFWGSAALMFDVRQSKRLFSIISAGDIPAKLVGYIVSAFLGKTLGQDNLLWIAFGSLVVSLYFYRLLVQTGALDQHHHNHNNHKKTEEHMNPTAEGAFHLVRKNALIRQAALISFFSYSGFILLTFLFFGYIKEASKTENESLGIYIAVFLAASRLITLVVKLAVTNRLADNLGIRNSLLITPVLLLVLSMFAIPVSMSNSLNFVFYTFATITIIIDVLRAAIQSPVLLAAMQPLPVHERLSGHTIIKGITDPFAFFFIGGILSLLFLFDTSVDYRVMSGILFLLVIGWIISALRFGTIYSNTLQKAIRNRSIQEREISITDRESLQILLDKISKGEPGEAILALRLAKNQPATVQSQILSSGLHHTSPYVQRETIHMAKDWKAAGIVPALKELANSASDHQVLAAAVSALTALDSNFDIAKYLNHPNPDVVLATIVHSLNRNDFSSPKAKTLLTSWAKSTDAAYRSRAASIMSDTSLPDFFPMLVTLMKDSNKHVSESAVQAAGKIKDAVLASELISILKDSTRQTLVLEALETSGGNAVEPIVNFTLQSTDETLQKKLIMLLGRIDDQRSNTALDRLVDELPTMKDTVFKAMQHHHFKVETLERNKYHRIVREYLNSSVHLTYTVRYLQQQSVNESLNSRF